MKKGQRTRIDYGNGTHTEYSYDPARRWLETIKTQNRGGNTFQNITYKFDEVGNVRGYDNICLDDGFGNYNTSQTYEYDDLYQLVYARGETTYDPYKSLVPDFKSTYEQVFEFDSDGLGNMMKKVSLETVTPRKTIGDNLNYTFDYEYDEKYAHRLIHAGNLYYQYDANGNVTCEQDGSFESNGDDVKYHKISEEADGVYSSDYGWGLFRDSDSAKTSSRYRRTYTWNERNQLICSKDASFTTNYIYGQDGQRTNKYTARSETLYFNKMWTLHTDSGNSVYGGQNAKNIYLGDTRIVTKLASPRENTIHEEYYKQYYYHSDHLGSASLISDYKGDEYQRIEYTPYGETWVEKTQNTGLEYLPYKFTGQEKDEETGNYFIGARYLQPQTCRWLSCDPAVGDYMSGSQVGMGGIYNPVNHNLYHYAGNNPLKMKDPTGMSIDDWQDNGDGTWTVKSEGAKLWDVWGADSYNVTGLTEEEARNIHVGDTFGKKNSLTNTDSSSENKQQNSQGNVQNANGLNAISVEKKQSTLSSWWSKKAGENLTDEEKNLQKGIGIGEMIAGPTLGTLGCAQTGGQSVLYGYYVMADGAVMVAKAEEGVKAIPGAFFLNLLCPVAGTANGVPVVVEYNMSPLPAGRYR